MVSLVALVEEVIFNSKFNKRETISDSSGGADITAGDFQQLGSDSVPMPADRQVLVPTEQAGRYICVGYIDDKLTQLSEAGANRMYSRDSGGEMIADLLLGNDGRAILTTPEAKVEIQANGSISVTNPECTFSCSPTGAVELKNNAGGMSISPSGTVDINGVVITPTGTVSVPLTIDAGAGITSAAALTGATIMSSTTGTTFDSHKHPVDTPNGETSPPTTGS